MEHDVLRECINNKVEELLQRKSLQPAWGFLRDMVEIVVKYK